MKKLLHISVAIIVAFLTADIFATTELVAPTLVVPTESIDDIIAGFDKIIDSNIQNMSNGTFFSNSTGYPIGTSLIKPFPHFFIGTSLGAGLTNLSFFDNDKSNTNKFPSGGVSGGLIFGTGLGKKVDFIGKFFYIDLLMYDPTSQPPLNGLPLDIKDFSIFTIGGKIRYRQIGERKLLPFLFNFNGLTLSAGADLMRGKFSSAADYSKTLDLGSIDLDGSLGPNPPEDVSLVISDYDLTIEWLQLSLTGTAYVYFNIIKFIDFYTGPSVTVGYGFFSLNSTINGNLESSGAVGINDAASLITESRYSPFPFLPAYTFGFELNIPFIKISAETSVNLYNKEDVTAVFGVRFQI